ncbi:MAG: prepilin-type N-terminal cleavage/methylation domain-containing protein [Candidatus Gracilibacteria bacterium]
MLIKNQKGFTLIEVLVASVILSSVFFAMMTLIANNTHQVNTLQHSQTMDELFLSSKACISSFGYATLQGISGTQSINFGTDNMGCFIGTYDSNLSFTGISLGQTNGTETGTTTFWSYFSVVDNTGSLKISNAIGDGIEEKKYDFIVGK